MICSLIDPPRLLMLNRHRWGERIITEATAWAVNNGITGLSNDLPQREMIFERRWYCTFTTCANWPVGQVQLWKCFFGVVWNCRKIDCLTRVLSRKKETEKYQLPCTAKLLYHWPQLSGEADWPGVDKRVFDVVLTWITHFLKAWPREVQLFPE